jgi:sugar transferase (PEP-CTERM system associated)
MIRLFRVFVPTSVVGLLLSETLLAFFCYLLASLLVSENDPVIELLYEGGLSRICFVVLSIILGNYLNDLYSDFRIRGRLRLLQQFCLVIGMAFLAQALLGYVDRNGVLKRWVMMFGSAFALVLMPIWRVIYSGAVLRASGHRKVLFLGDSELVSDIAIRMKARPQLGLASIGFLGDGDGAGPEELGPCLGTAAELKAAVRRLQPDLIVSGMIERRGKLPVSELLDLRLSGLEIEDAPSLYETLFGRVSVKTLRPSQLIFSSSLGPNPTNVMLQQAYSRVIALTGLVVTIPLLLLVALLIRLTSRGPVLYKQKRVGQNGLVFDLYKFRSMRVDAEEETGAVWATEDDPRVTTVGRWLRQARLDELPQLYNVLRGDMSIVGPRPERPEFVRTLSEQIPFYRQRNCVKPGITGWAQINHGYGDSIEETIAKLEHDLYYIKNLGPSLDLLIIFHTMKVMLQARGSR